MADYKSVYVTIIIYHHLHILTHDATIMCDCKISMHSWIFWQMVRDSREATHLYSPNYYYAVNDSE